MDSFEFNNLIPEKQPKPKKQISKKRRNIMIISIGIILIVILMIVLYIKNPAVRDFFDKYIFRKEVYENNLDAIALNEEDTNYAYVFDKNIAVLSGNNLTIYNSSAKKENTLNVEISNPIFDANGKNLVIAEKNGQKIYSVSKNNILWQKSIEGEITNITVNKNGYVSVVTNSTGYKTIIITYDANGNQLFAIHLATEYVVAVSISEDNKYLAIAEANFSGTLIQSNIKVVSIDRQRKEEYNYEAEVNKLIINVEYQKNKLVCMYDDSVQVIENNNVTELIKYDNNTLFLNVKLNSVVAQIQKLSDGSLDTNSKIKFISTSNNTVKTYDINEIPKAMYSCNDIVGVNFGTTAIFVKTNGWLVKRYISTQEIQEVILNDNIAGIIYKNKIEIIKL